MDKSLVSTNLLGYCQKIEDVLKFKLIDSVSLPSTNTNGKDGRLVLPLHKPKDKVRVYKDVEASNNRDNTS